MKKIFIAVPIDSGISMFSRDFKIPEKIGDNQISIHYCDTKDIKCDGSSMGRKYEKYFNCERLCMQKVIFARQKLVENFLETDSDILLFLDSDIIINNGEDLIPLIVSPYLVSTTISAFRAFWDVDYKKNNELKEIFNSFIPLWCTAIKRDVFTILVPPYFTIGVSHARDDVIFFHKIQQAKINYFVFSEIDIGHQCREAHNIYYFNKDRTEVIKI